MKIEQGALSKSVPASFSRRQLPPFGTSRCLLAPHVKNSFSGSVFSCRQWPPICTSGCLLAHQVAAFQLFASPAATSWYLWLPLGTSHKERFLRIPSSCRQRPPDCHWQPRSMQARLFYSIDFQASEQRAKHCQCNSISCMS